MEEEQYRKEIRIIEKTKEEKDIELLISILKTKKELEEANHNFEYAEEELIDYYTYQIKAISSKYDYLVKKAKENQIVLNLIDQIDIKYNKAI
ncbi:MAG: YaaL family protein [Clostridiaceae bacterium]|nr:YaaL family protein [Clostridiaceae bacterium]